MVCDDGEFTPVDIHVEMKMKNRPSDGQRSVCEYRCSTGVSDLMILISLAFHCARMPARLTGLASMTICFFGWVIVCHGAALRNMLSGLLESLLLFGST